jgi:hypothetical protein
MSELGGYSLLKIMATLKRNATLNMVKISRVLFCVVFDHRWNEYDYHFSWKRFIAFSKGGVAKSA